MELSEKQIQVIRKALEYAIEHARTNREIAEFARVKIDIDEELSTEDA